MTTGKRQPVFLRVLKDGKLIEVKQFAEGHDNQIVIGREGEVSVLLDDPALSPIHTMIELREDGVYYLCDLGGAAGTLVGGERIIDIPLETGMEFSVGGYTLEFHLGIPKIKRKDSDSTVVIEKSEIEKTKEEPILAAKVPEKKPEPEQPKATPKPPPKATPKKATPPVIPVTIPPVKQAPTPPKESGMRATPPKSPPKASALRPTASTGGLDKHSHESGGTFLPPSEAVFAKNLKPGRGSTIEVMVFWKDRVLDVKHFDQPGVVTIGAHPKNNIVLPMFGSVTQSRPLLRIDSGVTIFITESMTGEVKKQGSSVNFSEIKRRGQLVPQGGEYSYILQQDELFRIDLGEGISISITWVGAAPKPMMVPLIDTSSPYLPWLVFMLLFAALFLLWVYIYSPEATLEPETEIEPPRKAQFLYKKKMIVESEMDKAQEAQNANKQMIKDKEVAPERAEEGKASQAKPNKSTSTKVMPTTNKAGKDKGIQKPKEQAKNDSGAKSVAPAPVKQQSVFGTKGLQNELSKAFQGAGNLAGQANSATGQAAEAAGAGTSPGLGLREIGVGGQGTATVGTSGVSTAGKGGGVKGYGTGGLGAKKNATILPGDNDATFSGSIDKEAIRRVVQQNLRQIKACYEQALNREPGLYGKITIQWQIGPGGRVLDAGIKTSTLNSKAVEGCAVNRLKTWKFPEPPAGEIAVVSYPFVFQAQE